MMKLTASMLALCVLGTTACSSDDDEEMALFVRNADLAYGAEPAGNLLDLYLPSDVEGDVPLLIWHSGSAWFSNTAKDEDDAVSIAENFTARGFAVATLSIRSSFDAPFPAQGYDVRAAIRYLRENAADHGIDTERFAFMGNSSGGWATAFAATTSNELELPGEPGVNGVSSAVHVAVPFFPPTDFLSMDAFAEANDLPQGFAYPHDAPTSPEGLLIQCPGEPAVVPAAPGPDLVAENPDLVSLQECPTEAEAADPSSYVDGEEIPMWVLHGLADELLPFNQSELLYEATTTQGNIARYTLVPTAGHSVNDIVGAENATTRTYEGSEIVTETTGPSWDDIEQFIRDGFGS